MDGFNHAASVSEVRQAVALKRDRVFGHYAVSKAASLVRFMVSAPVRSAPAHV